MLSKVDFKVDKKILQGKYTVWDIVQTDLITLRQYKCWSFPALSWCLYWFECCWSHCRLSSAKEQIVPSAPRLCLTAVIMLISWTQGRNSVMLEWWMLFFKVQSVTFTYFMCIIEYFIERKHRVFSFISGTMWMSPSWHLCCSLNWTYRDIAEVFVSTACSPDAGKAWHAGCPDKN